MLSLAFFYFPNSRTTSRDVDANGFFAFMRVVRSPPLLLATFYSATRSVPWLPWLPSPDPSRSTTARHPHMVHYAMEAKKKARSARLAAKLTALHRSARFFRHRDSTRLNDVAAKYIDSTRNNKRIRNNKN